jgi:hypothetical protein
MMQEELGAGGMRIARADAKRDRRVQIRLEVDQQHGLAHASQHGRHVHGGRRLTRTALRIEGCNDQTNALRLLLLGA